MVTCLAFFEVKNHTQNVGVAGNPHIKLFAWFCHLRGEPRSRAQICMHCGAYDVRFSLNCAPIPVSKHYM